MPNCLVIFILLMGVELIFFPKRRGLQTVNIQHQSFMPFGCKPNANRLGREK